MTEAQRAMLIAGIVETNAGLVGLVPEYMRRELGLGTPTLARQ
jgi:hypothetical protein